jgi:hypothetical protein
VCIAAQCHTDARRAEVKGARSYGPERVPSFPPGAAPADAHQKPMKQTFPHLAETLGRLPGGRRVAAGARTAAAGGRPQAGLEIVERILTAAPKWTDDAAPTDGAIA